MKRFILGILVLAVLLGACLGAGAFQASLRESVTRELYRAAEAAGAGSLPAAHGHTRSARLLWEKRRPLTAALCDHTPMEDIENLFAQLALQTDEEDFLSACTGLILRIQALEDAHKLTLQNLL